MSDADDDEDPDASDDYDDDDVKQGQSNIRIWEQS